MSDDTLVRIAEDLDVSLDTKGFYLWLITRPELMRCSRTAIYDEAKAAGQPVGKDKFMRMMRELCDCGYYAQPERDHYGSLRGKRGSIYVAYSAIVDRVKVGASKDPLARVVALRPKSTMVWWHKVPDMGTAECRIHQRLIDYRDMDFGLEWFKVDVSHAKAIALAEVA